MGSPDLPELLGPDFQVVQGSSHGHHNLVGVAGSDADVLPIGLFPLAHQGFGLLADQSHRGRGDLGRETGKIMENSISKVGGTARTSLFPYPLETRTQDPVC